MNSKKAKKSDPPPGDGGAPAWLVTYGDMMSLLLTFFVVIVSFSTIEIEKFRAALGAFRGALQPWSPSQGGKALIKQPAINITDDRMMETIEEVVDIIEEEGLAAWVEVYQTARGIRIVFSDPVLFDEGKADLKPGVDAMLNRLVKVAQGSGAEEVLIEGHTDDTPIRTIQFPSNWELSAARALTVLKVFQAAGFPPGRLAAVGYGEFRPKVKVSRWASREEKAPNRRVEMFLRYKIGDGLFSNLNAPDSDVKWGD